MVNLRLCPTCKQPLPRGKSDHKRICALCKQPIGRHDKYLFLKRDVLTIIVHRNCEHPESYGETEIVNKDQISIV